MQHFSATPKEMFASLWRHRDLIRASAKREVLGRYQGSALGLLWSLFNPIFMLVIYTFVFSVVFKARWTGGSESKTEFALVLFAGLMVFNIFAESIARAPGLILSNTNYVKRVVFPLEILPFVSLLSALFHGLISFGVWLIAYFLIFGVPHAAVLYLPLILIPFIFFIMGLSWMLASMCGYLRDVGQFIGILTMVLMFLSPIFYPIAAVPERFRSVLFMNPLTLVIEQVRAVMYFGVSPSLLLLFVYFLVAFVVAWLGFAWFQKTRKGFADVL